MFGSQMGACKKIILRKIDEIFCYLPTQFFNQVTGGISQSGVRSTYSSRAWGLFFQNSKFGDYPPIASAFVEDSRALVKTEPQNFRPRAVLTSV